MAKVPGVSLRLRRVPALLMSFTVLGTLDCAGSEAPTQYNPDSVSYEGAPYGDFLILADAVRSCMHSKKASLPRIVLIQGIFECYTTVGWRQVFGCTGNGEVFLDAHVVVDTMGALWSHELTHFFGASTEDNPCGLISLDGFSISRTDAGTAK